VRLTSVTNRLKAASCSRSSGSVVFIKDRSRKSPCNFTAKGQRRDCSATLGTNRRLQTSHIQLAFHIKTGIGTSTSRIEKPEFNQWIKVRRDDKVTMTRDQKSAEHPVPETSTRAFKQLAPSSVSEPPRQV
jgi:hypothetical protein